ncbi:MAG TPA: sigma-70 family RNA polymerase sigma factor [Longimicrobiales bacterium]
MGLNAEALFREHHLGLYRYLVRLTGDEAEAKDAVQHAFLRLLEQPPEDQRVKAWLFTVATNAVREWNRNERRRDTLIRDNAWRVPAPGRPARPDEGPDPSEVARLRDALGKLSERERAVLLLRTEGLRHREIADAVGTTTGSVGTMVARALDRLSEILDPEGGS